MNPIPNRSKRIIPALWVAVLAVGFAMGQDEDSDDGGNKPEITVDTLGKLSGHVLTLTTSTVHEWFTRGNERFETGFSLSIRVPDKETGPKAMKDEDLISWASSEFGNGISAPQAPKIEAKKNTLKIHCGISPAEFIYGKEGLVLSPAFVKAIVKNLEKTDYPYDIGCLQEIFAGSTFSDSLVINTLRLYVIRDSIRAGFLDEALESLADLSMAGPGVPFPPDEATLRYCKRLSDSLRAAKRKMQPLRLEGAKKVGKILTDPIYPPLDKPTVFWKDGLVAVVQEDSKPVKMRTFDPGTGKWGKPEPVRYPETIIAELYPKEPGSYDSDCPNATFCWRKALGKPSDDPCEGLECDPLIMLKEEGGGSVYDIEHRRRAGGVSTAGNGELVFFGHGMLSSKSNDKLSWTVLPGEALSGIREYPSGSHLSPPVVVSPDEKWVAYALSSKQGDAKELWVAKLVYKN